MAPGGGLSALGSERPEQIRPLLGGDVKLVEFELARPGVALYGGEALNDVPNPMKPVVKLEGRIVQIRQAYAGDAVGYGGAQVLKRDSRIAYISVGYADGYPWRLSNAATVSVGGQSVPVVGRVSMDMISVDLTECPQVRSGDEVILWGEAPTVESLAAQLDTSPYELLTGIGPRVVRQSV